MVTKSKRSVVCPPRRWYGLRAWVSSLAMVMPLVAVAAEPTVTLSFKDADIEQVVGAYGQFLERQVFVDSRVKGKINLDAQRPVTRDQAMRLLATALKSQGYALVDSGSVLRVMPEAESKSLPGPVVMGAGGAYNGDQVVTQVFKLSNESATQLVTLLKPLVSPNQTISALTTGNAVVVTDSADNLRRIGKIIQALDGPVAAEAEVMPLKHALAVDMAATLNRLLDDGARGVPVDPGQKIVVVAEARTNSLIIRTASAQRLLLARKLVDKLDQPTTQPGNVHVVYLKNAEASKLAGTLRSVLTGDTSALTGSNNNTLSGGTSTSATNPGSTTSSPMGGNAGVQQTLSTLTGANTPTGTGIVQADPATNSLIITAPEPVYRNLRAVIERLDARRAQVYIESLIAEVTAEKAAEFGFQFQALNGLSSNSAQVFGGTNFSSPITGSGSNILSVATSPLSAASGLNLALLSGAKTIGSATVLNLGLLARALETKANANILATPNLVTLDNEEAKIVIGQNVPFLTGQYSTPGASSTTGVTSFQTIERRDVGTTLRVRPQVSDGGTVRLQIFQEVSSVASQSAQGPVTNRRAIESNVLVDDGQVIVIGGLIEERIEGGESSVPGLGAIPVLGQLFRYDNRKRVKTNLLVFLRPIIMRTPDAAGSVTADRYDYMRQLQSNSQLPNHWALPDMQSPVLPELPAGIKAAPKAPPEGAEPAEGAGGEVTAQGRTENRAEVRPVPRPLHLDWQEQRR